MMDSVLECLDRKEVRQRILEVYTEGHDENWQKNGTPGWIARDMVGLVKDSPELVYVVLFNHEFLEELVFERGIAKEHIIFMADCADEGVLSTGVYGVRTMVLPQEIRDPKKTIEFVAEKLCKVLYEGGPMPKTNNLVVFGNPPYNSGSNGKDSKPIYNLFVGAVLDYVNPRYFSFIIPSKWMVGGKIPEAYRQRMIKDRHHKMLRHFPDQNSVFSKDVSTKGGVSYFLWDRDYNGKCHFYNGANDTVGMLRYLDDYPIVVLDNKALPIIDKVHASHRGAYLAASVLPRKPFGLRSDYKGFLAHGVVCHCRGNEKNFVDPHCFTDKSSALGKWKVCTSKGTSEGNVNPDATGSYKVVTNIFLIPPGEICTETYLVVHLFDTEEEAISFKSYMLTKVFRFLLGENLAGNQNISRENFAWIPELPSYQGVITDTYLKDLLNISDEEMLYIQKKIS